MKWITYDEEGMKKGEALITKFPKADVTFYPRAKLLVISEKGKSFDDHAVATFKANNTKEAEEILTKLFEIYTA